MVMLVLAFVSGLIAANWITLQFDDRVIQLLSAGLDQAKGLFKKGFEMVWSRYQSHQPQNLASLNHEDVIAAEFYGGTADSNIAAYQVDTAQK